MKRFFLYISLLLSTSVSAQTRLTLTDAISIAQKQSLSAMVARLNFMSSYWSNRSFKAEFLPAVNLSGELMQYNHSTVEARNAETGVINMVDNNSLTNSLTLSVDQNISALGGTLSVQSYLYRLDQFNEKSKTYNSQPLRLQYAQPLFAFNSLKWQKKTEPLKYEKAKRLYLETQESVTNNVVLLFFNVLSAQSEAEQSKANLEDRERLFEMAKKRLALGTTTKGDVLQLELSLINARVTAKEKGLALSSARFALRNYLMLPPQTEVELIAPMDVPQIVLSEPEVIVKALDNSTFAQKQKLSTLEAEKAVAQAKAARGIQMKVTADVGFNRTANYLRDAYRGLENSQVVGVSVSMPIFDWGESRGRVRMAEADLEAVKTSNKQEYEQYVQDIRTSVMRFNMQNDQCSAALRAQEIATERYEITRKRFEAGGVTVTDLNTAWQEAESARASYIAQLQTYWSSYYSLRKTTLYDWITNRDLTTDYNFLINE